MNLGTDRVCSGKRHGCQPPHCENVTQDRFSVLVIDPDPELRQALCSQLTALNFTVQDAESGAAALEIARSKKPDAVTLELKLPDRNGIHICEEMHRLYPGMPIVVLTVLGRIDSLEKSFAAGADDFIGKPFRLRELVSRLCAALRRAKQTYVPNQELVRVGEIDLCPKMRCVKKRGVSIRLTPKEFHVLHYLMRHAGSPVAHGRLLQTVWGSEHVESIEYLRTFIRQLRVKLEDSPARPTYLLTCPHVGYLFSEEMSGK